jgi:lysozyme family protein
MSLVHNQLFALIVQTNEAIERARTAGDQASAAQLEILLADARRAAARLALSNLAEAAAELAELAVRLERSEREIPEAINSFFLGDLSESRRGIEEVAAEFGEQVRPAPAAEEPDEVLETASSDTISQGTVPSEGADLAIPPKEPAEYVACFAALVFRPTWRDKADAAVNKIAREDAAARYRRVEEKTGVPWWFVGVLHMMETSQRFNAHLHNGDPLSAETVRVPARRPVNWQPGMPWELSAADALMNGDHRLHEVEDWSLGNALRLMERYNGLGYRKRKRMSPYIWSGSTFFDKGKFVADGQFDPDATSDQVGGALLIRRLADKGFVSISSGSAISPKPASVLGSADLAAMDFSVFKHAAAEVEFPLAANGVLRKGAGGPNGTQEERLAVKRIQEWCCLHESRTAIDGDFGPATETAVKLFQQRNSLSVKGIVDRQTWTLLTAPMRRAIAPIAHTGSLNEAVLAVAKQHLTQVPKEVGGNNMGPWVRLYMKGKEGEAQRWCAGFVCSLVLQAVSDLGGTMPFKRQVGVDALVKDAKDSGRFIGEASLGDPMVRRSKVVPGSLFVIRKSATDWTHVGIVTEVRDDNFLTIEGNTNGDNVDGGNATFSSRGFGAKDFLLLT